MFLLSHWFKRKIKEYQFQRKAVLENDLIRKSFSGEGNGRALTLISVRNRIFPALLSITLVIVLPFVIWGSGSSRVNPPDIETLPPLSLVKETPPPSASRPPSELKSEVKKEETREARVLTEKPRLIETEKDVAPPPSVAEEALPLPDEKWEAIQNRDAFLHRPVRNTVLVDKANRKLYVARRQEDRYEIIREFSVSVGEIQGNKMDQGDKRTPEGIYKIIDVKFDEELLPMFGPMAFVLSYPNDRDRLLGKTGSGIWLHGTGVGELTPDTKGCVELTDAGIVDLSSYLSYGTPIFIFPARRPLVKQEGGIPISLVNGLEIEYLRELPLLKARLEGRRKG